jgi:hypothetical protein
MIYHEDVSAQSNERQLVEKHAWLDENAAPTPGR